MSFCHRFLLVTSLPSQCQTTVVRLLRLPLQSYRFSIGCLKLLTKLEREAGFPSFLFKKINKKKCCIMKLQCRRNGSFSLALLSFRTQSLNHHKILRSTMSGGVNIRCHSSVQQWETCCEKQEEHYLEKWQAVRIIFRPAALILASIWRVYNKTTWCLTRGSPHAKNHRQKYAGTKRRQTAGPRLSPRLIFKLQMCETNTFARHSRRAHEARQDTNQVSKAPVEAFD